MPNIMQFGVFGVAAFIVWLVLVALFPQLATVSLAAPLGAVAALALAGGLLALVRVFAGIKIFPYKVNAIQAVAVLAVGLVIGGIPLFGFTLGAATLAPVAPSLPAATVVATAEECLARVDPEIRGTSATATLNAYDLEANSPFAAALDAGTVYIYKATTVGEGTSANYVTSTSDTTNNGVTGFKVGDVISLAGGNATGTVAGAFYIESSNGICLDGQQNTVNLNAHMWEAEGSLQATVYDSTSSVELGGGTVGIEYTAAQGANSDISYYVRVRPNSANNAYWLGGYAFAWGTNLSSVKPSGTSASLFGPQVTPGFLKDVLVQTVDVGDDTGDSPMTRTYSYYKLNTPVMLHAFDEFKFGFNVKAGSNDPVGSPNSTLWSGVVGVALDQAYARGADGKLYLDVHDHAIVDSEANIGVTESVTSPMGGTSGFGLTIT